jgi:hypothetical protein
VISDNFTLITTARLSSAAQRRISHENAVRALAILGRVERHLQSEPAALAVILAAMVRASWDLEQQRVM